LLLLLQGRRLFWLIVVCSSGYLQFALLMCQTSTVTTNIIFYLLSLAFVACVSVRKAAGTETEGTFKAKRHVIR
jgi:hypothetical protein